jgi:hypothetical protein
MSRRIGFAHAFAVCVAASSIAGSAHGSVPRSWRLIASTPAFPPTLALPVGVYDPTRQRVLVVDGGGSVPTQVWAFNPSAQPRWSRLATKGAPPQQLFVPSVVLDPGRDRLLLLGSGSSFQVWALDLTGVPTWHQLPCEGGPSSRFGHSSVYDPVNDCVIVFGGTSDGGGSISSYFSDVWVLSLATGTWSQVIISGPAPGPREGHGAMFDPVRRRMLVFGGHLEDNGRAFRNDTWALSLDDPMAWTELEPNGPLPGPRSAFGTVYDPVRRRMLVHGGINAQSGVEPDDLWALALDSTPAWSPIVTAETLRGRSYPVDVYEPVQDRLLACGGDGYPQVSALPLADPATWIAVDPPRPLPSPGARSGAGLLYDPRRDRFLVIGGGYSTVDSATWSFQFAGQPHWQPLRTPVAPPLGFFSDHSCATVFDSLADRVLLFDGWRAWSAPAAKPDAWTQIGPEFPDHWAVGSACGMAIDTRRNRLILTGGFVPYPHSAGYTLSGVWGLSLGADATWSRIGELPQFDVTSTGAYGHTTWYDPAQDRLILLGGTFVFDSPRTRHSFGAVVWVTPLDSVLTWRRSGPVRDAQIPGPPNARATYDARTERLFLASDSTLWNRGVDDPVSWVRVELAGERPLLNNALGFDPRHKELVTLFAPLPGSDRVNAWSLAVGGKPSTALNDELTTGPGIGSPRLEMLDTSPSPAVGRLTVAFRLPGYGSVLLEVFDVLGRCRFTRDVGSLGPDVHVLPLTGSEHWDAGVYFARLTRGEECRTRRLVLLR